jgi:hypothetical protein
VWWPAEAKARKRGQAKTAFKEAFVQLMAYWWELMEAGGPLEDVGYGIIMIAEYQMARPNFTAHILVPWEPRKVQRFFQMLRRATPTRRTLGHYLRSFSASGTGAGKLTRTLELFHG